MAFETCGFRLPNAGRLSVGFNLRSSAIPFNPIAVFTGGIPGAVWDASAIPPQSLGTEVLLMSDISGNGIHATGVAGTAMTYQTDGNGKTFLRGTGAQFMSFASSMYGTDGPIEVMAAFALEGAGNFPSIFGGNSTSVGVFFNAGDGNDRRPRLSFGGGTGGAGILRGPTPFVLNTPSVMAMRYFNGEIVGMVDGVEIGRIGRSGTFGVAGTGRIGYTASTLSSPIRFYAGVIIRKELTAIERVNIGLWLASKCGSTYTNSVTAPVVGGPDTVFALGDSTVAPYAGGTGVLALTNSIYNKVSLAVPGDTINQQRDDWAAYAVNTTTPKWAIIQVGLNDLTPGETAATALIRLQTLVNEVRFKAGIACKIFISQMVPCRSRMMALYGATNGPISYQKWLDMNAAIAGSGANPITGVDGRITSHVAPMGDGAGNLKAEYDSGDGIHPNTAGRVINAQAWTDALTAAGVMI